MKDLKFELTQEHITLLRAAYVRWDDCEYGAPAIDSKRPYGNSDVLVDIAETLGWIETCPEIDLGPEDVERAERIHKETETALQIVLRTGVMAPGTYTRTTNYTTDWKREGT